MSKKQKKVLAGVLGGAVFLRHFCCHQVEALVAEFGLDHLKK